MRKEEFTHSMMHYLLSVHRLNEEGKRSKPTDIATSLGFARSTVTIALKRLCRKNFFIEDKQGNLHLSAKGHRQVHEVLSNKTLFYYFFTDVLGVSQQNAAQDSCLVEHLICQEVQGKLFDFLKKNAHKFTKVPCQRKSLIHLPLRKFKNLKDFNHNQRGDSALTQRKVREIN
ncbi:MAG: iron dependent repressor, metal binding and dimerization domain protein [Pseudomonadota bacterium]